MNDYKPSVSLKTSSETIPTGNSPARPRYLDLVSATAQMIAEMNGLDTEKIYKVQTAIEELYTNAVHHGNKEDPTKSVTVEFFSRPEEIEIRVKDQGQKFDPTRYLVPEEERRLDSTGRGLLLAKAFSDDLKFSYDNGNYIKMKFYGSSVPSEEKAAVLTSP